MWDSPSESVLVELSWRTAWVAVHAAGAAGLVQAGLHVPTKSTSGEHIASPQNAIEPTVLSEGSDDARSRAVYVRGLVPQVHQTFMNPRCIPAERASL